MSEQNAYLRPDVLARITKLGLRAQRVVEGTISGLHKSPMHGLSVEFADYRQYTAGDDLKRLDWRVYARTNRHFIKEFEEETNLRATLVLDASASMKYGRGAMTKFDYAATLCASMAHMLIKQGDAVGLAVFDQQQRELLRPSGTGSQLAKIVHTLETTQPDRETDVGSVLKELAHRLNRRGLLMIVSDLLCDLDLFYHGLGRLQHQGHEIIVFQVLDRDEIELPFQDTVLFKDLEGDEQLFAEPWAFRKAYQEAMGEFIGEVQRRCRFCGIDHVLLHSDDDLSLALSHYLHRRQRIAGIGRGGRMSSLTGGGGGGGGAATPSVPARASTDTEADA
ncbi:MAG: DUF58 domain-containing protein [Phycisphaera sp.]|nr:DUF58 domain-containing protein [Phycisphaera sp.]